MHAYRFSALCISVIALLAPACSENKPGSGSGDGSVELDVTTTPREAGSDGRVALEAAVDGGTGIVRECNIATQNCPTGQKCTVTLRVVRGENEGLIGYRCVPIVRGGGPLADDDVCAEPPWSMYSAEGTFDLYSDLCDRGASCMGTPEVRGTRVANYCKKFCNNDVPCAGANERCLALPFDNTLGTCMRVDDCDPVTQEGCAANSSCILLNNQFPKCALRFVAPDAGVLTPPGGSCDSRFTNALANTCVPGSQCFNVTTRDGGMFSQCLGYCSDFVVDGDGGVIRLDAAAPPADTGTPVIDGDAGVPDGDAAVAMDGSADAVPSDASTTRPDGARVPPGPPKFCATPQVCQPLALLPNAGVAGVCLQ